MNKKIISILLISIAFIIAVPFLSYYMASQPNQPPNNSPTPTPTPEATATPTPTPSPTKKPSTSSSSSSGLQFTVTFEAYPYDVPPTYSVDRYTGETVMTSPGYHVENKSIVVRIKSVSFTPYTDADGNSISLSYLIRAKGHFEESWTNLETVGPSDSNYVVRYYAYEGGDGPGILQYVPSGGEVDFQVQAQIGYYTDDMSNCRRYFTGETRDSSIITISFP